MRTSAHITKRKGMKEERKEERKEGRKGGRERKGGRGRTK